MCRFYNDALNASCGTPGDWGASVLEVFSFDQKHQKHHHHLLRQGLFVTLVSASVCTLSFIMLGCQKVWATSCFKKLASLEATLVQNYDRLTDSLTEGGEV